MSGWLMCVRGAEAEPVLVEHDVDRVTLVLDDGERVSFDRCELLLAIEQPNLKIGEAA